MGPDYRSNGERVKVLMSGRGGGQVVSVLAFNSDDPDSSPPEINTRLIVRK